MSCNERLVFAIPVDSAFRSVLIMQMSYACVPRLLKILYEYLLVFVVTLALLPFQLASARLSCP